MALTADEWRSLVLRAVDDDGTVNAVWNALWERRAGLDTADPTGELRYLAVVRDALDLMLANAAKVVRTSEGGQSGDWGDYFEHLGKLREQYEKEFQALATSVTTTTGIVIDTMTTYSLTPVADGFQPDPAHPGYMGDPRYRRTVR
jgi:hypothetical protein